jgi:hypothetical protein
VADVRRNLVFDTYFGIKAGATAGWLGGRPPSAIDYVAESNMIRSVVTLGGVQTESLLSALVSGCPRDADEGHELVVARSR